MSLEERTEMPDRKIKVVFFDMEGTILRPQYEHNKYTKVNVAPSMWTKIAEHLGRKALEEEEETKRKWTAGEYKSYVEWMEDTIRIHQKYGLTRQFFMRLIRDFTHYYPGVREVFQGLRKRGIKTALISGGFKNQADIVQKELRIDHAFSACEYFFGGKGKLVHWNLLPCDYEGKIDFMRLLMREYGLGREDVAFVGDGKNDVALAKEVHFSIAFNADPALQKVASCSINQERGKEDFRAILKECEI